MLFISESRHAGINGTPNPISLPPTRNGLQATLDLNLARCRPCCAWLCGRLDPDP